VSSASVLVVAALAVERRLVLEVLAFPRLSEVLAHFLRAFRPRGSLER